jgi:hypothetical protein
MKIIPLNGDVIVNLVNNQNGMFFSLQWVANCDYNKFSIFIDALNIPTVFE